LSQEITMHHFPRLWPWSRFRLALALLSGALLFTSLPIRAAELGSCQPQSTSGSRVGCVYLATPLNHGQSGVRSPFELRLSVRIAPDGSARVSGVIALPRDSAATSTLAPYAPVLIATKSVVSVGCTDLDQDGGSGLARFEADFRSLETGERVRVVLAPVAHDVDAAGVYAVVLQIGPETLSGETRFAIAGDWSHRRNRGR
jgi:hypothetical protein